MGISTKWRYITCTDWPCAADIANDNDGKDTSDDGSAVRRAEVVRVQHTHQVDCVCV